MGVTALILTALIGLGGCGGGGGSESTQTLPTVPVAPGLALGEHGGAAELRLALQFRPYLKFDSAERWRPLEIHRFLAERYPGGGAHLGCPGGEAPCSAVSRPIDLKDEVPYLDLHGHIDDGADAYAPPAGPCVVRAPLDCDGGPSSAVYYRRTSHDGRWYWDYWAFYRYNDYNGRQNRCEFYCDDHEGDWEGLTVITTASRRPQVVGAIYAAHTDRIEVAKEALLMHQSHVIAFPANGTHATYRFRCESDCRQYASLFGNPLPEENHDGGVAWSENRDSACLADRCIRPLPESSLDADISFPVPISWNGWPGRWGETCHGGCGKNGASPRSPGLQVRYLCPWVPTRRDPGNAPITQPRGGQPASSGIGDADSQVAACERQAQTPSVVPRD